VNSDSKHICIIHKPYDLIAEDDKWDPLISIINATISLLWVGSLCVAGPTHATSPTTTRERRGAWAASCGGTVGGGAQSCRTRGRHRGTDVAASVPCCDTPLRPPS
jgi:hypothetical protein